MAEGRDLIQLRYGIKDYLGTPAEYEPVYITDENELYIGQGEGVPPIKVTNNFDISELDEILENAEMQMEDIMQAVLEATGTAIRAEEKVAEINTKVSRLETDMDKVATQVADIDDRVRVVEPLIENVPHLRNEVAVIGDNVVSVETKANNLDSRTTEIETKVPKIDARVIKTEQDINSIQETLEDKVDKSQVLKNVPLDAEFTDTTTTINGKTGAISKEDIIKLGFDPQSGNAIIQQDTVPEGIVEGRIWLDTSQNNQHNLLVVKIKQGGTFTSSELLEGEIGFIYE